MNSVLLVGCGNMGVAMLQGWKNGLPGLSIHVVDPNPAFREVACDLGADANAVAEEVGEDIAPTLIIFAVKPQIMADVLAEYARFAFCGATFLTLAAGLTLDWFARRLPNGTPIIRCVPNLPIAVRAGATVGIANAYVKEPVRNLCAALFESNGVFEFVDDETLIDPVVALSGSGPAYVFHLIEALKEGGKNLRLPSDLAERLAVWTVYGAGLQAMQSDLTAAELRRQVSSPKGTTLAALEVMRKDDRMVSLVSRAMEAAADRSREIARELEVRRIVPSDPSATDASAD